MSQSLAAAQQACMRHVECMRQQFDTRAAIAAVALLRGPSSMTSLSYACACLTVLVSWVSAALLHQVHCMHRWGPDTGTHQFSIGF